VHPACHAHRSANDYLLTNRPSRARERRYGRVVDVFVGYVATGMLYGPAARRFMTGDGGGSRDRQADSAQASVPPSSEFWRGWRSWCRHRRRRPRAAASKGRPSRVSTMS